jgi:hypothetical protein
MKATKSLFFLTLALLILSSGCGGGGEESDSTAATSGAGEGSTSSAEASQAAKGEEVPAAKNTAKEAPEESAKGSSGEKDQAKAAPTDPKPLPNQGSDAIAPGVPIVKGGDNSIAEYGAEADSAERIEAAQIAATYLAGQANGEWTEVCSQLWAPVRERLDSLGEQATPPGGCAAAMEALLAKKSEAELKSAADIEVLSLRIQGQRAFVIYRDGAGEPFNLPLIDAGGQWKITTVAPIAMVL